MKILNYLFQKFLKFYFNFFVTTRKIPSPDAMDADDQSYSGDVNEVSGDSPSVEVSGQQRVKRQNSSTYPGPSLQVPKARILLSSIE